MGEKRVSGEFDNGCLFDAVIMSKNDKEIDSIKCLDPKSTEEVEKQFNKFESYVKKTYSINHHTFS